MTHLIQLPNLSLLPLGIGGVFVLVMLLVVYMAWNQAKP